MARVRKINRKTDGDSIFSLYADSSYKGAEAFVVGSGMRAYFTVHTPERSFAAFSGRKTLRKFARAILRATR